MSWSSSFLCSKNLQITFKGISSAIGQCSWANCIHVYWIGLSALQVKERTTCINLA